MISPQQLIIAHKIAQDSKFPWAELSPQLIMNNCARLMPDQIRDLVLSSSINPNGSNKLFPILEGDTIKGTTPFGINFHVFPEGEWTLFWDRGFSVTAGCDNNGPFFQISTECFIRKPELDLLKGQVNAEMTRLAKVLGVDLPELEIL